MIAADSEQNLSGVRQYTAATWAKVWESNARLREAWQTIVAYQRLLSQLPEKEAELRATAEWLAQLPDDPYARALSAQFLELTREFDNIRQEARPLTMRIKKALREIGKAPAEADNVVGELENVVGNDTQLGFALTTGAVIGITAAGIAAIAAVSLAVQTIMPGMVRTFEMIATYNQIRMTTSPEQWARLSPQDKMKIMKSARRAGKSLLDLLWGDLPKYATVAFVAFSLSRLSLEGVFAGVSSVMGRSTSSYSSYRS